MLDINYLKQNHKMIHFFGLGFVQLKISNTLRYHFYHPSLTAIVFDEEVHNHRYDFTSTIIAGELTEELYSFEIASDGKFVLEYVSCEKDIEPPTMTEIGNLTLIEKLIYTRYTTYSRQKTDFHKVNTKFCITKLNRDTQKNSFAKVVHSIDKDMICPFNKPLSTNECWEIIEDSLRLMKQ